MLCSRTSFRRWLLHEILSTLRSQSALSLNIFCCIENRILTDLCLSFSAEYRLLQMATEPTQIYCSTESCSSHLLFQLDELLFIGQLLIRETRQVHEPSIGQAVLTFPQNSHTGQIVPAVHLDLSQKVISGLFSYEITISALLEVKSISQRRNTSSLDLEMCLRWPVAMI